MKVVFIPRGEVGGSGPAPPEPLNAGLALIDGGNAATLYSDSYDNGSASNPAPDVSIDFGRSA